MGLVPLRHPVNASTSEPKKIIAQASTVVMASKATPSFPNSSIDHDSWRNSPATAPKAPYSDYTRRDTIVVISQPSGQSCGVVGGIMATRMKHLGAQGIVVDGRVRDLVSLAELGLPVWSKGTSIIGAGAETKVHALDCPLKIGETDVKPGDIVMIDPFENGVVAIPHEKVDEVLALLPKLVAADEKVIEEVEAGISVAEAFKRHRNT